MKLLRIAFAFGALLVNIVAASAQTYPARPISLIVPHPAGGPTDTIARIIAERMTRALGQTLVVENVSGAGGSIAVARLARAAPDGYTIGIGHLGTHVVSGAIYPLQFDLLRDIEPVAMVASNPQLIVSKIAVPARDLKELVNWVKANNDKVSAGTGGMGTPAHISAVYFENTVGAHFQIAHYRGAAPAMNDLIGGHIDLIFDQAANALPQVRAGKIRAYAVTSRTRLAAAPDIPTVDEAGVPGLYMAVWHGIWAPRNTPNPIVGRLNAAIVEALADSGVRQRLADLGQEIPSRDLQTPEGFGSHHKSEIEKWWPLIKSAGIKAE